MFTSKFWSDAFERMVRAAASSALALTGGGAVFDIRDLDPAKVAGVSGGAALVSLLLSLAATRVGDATDASLRK